MFNEKTLAALFKKPERGSLVVYRPEEDEWHYWVSDMCTLFRVSNNFPLLQKRELFPELPAAGETMKLDTAAKTPAAKLEGNMMIPEYLAKRKAEEQEPVKITPWTYRAEERNVALHVRRLFVRESDGEVVYIDQKYAECLLGDGVMENYDYSIPKGWSAGLAPILVWVGEELAACICPMHPEYGIAKACRFEQRPESKTAFFYVEEEAA